VTDTLKKTCVFNRICISPELLAGDLGPFSRRQGQNCSRHSRTVVTIASMIEHNVTWRQSFTSWRHVSTSLTQSQNVRTPRTLTANSPTNRHQNLNPDHPHRIALCYKHQWRNSMDFTYTNKQGGLWTIQQSIRKQTASTYTIPNMLTAKTHHSTEKRDCRHSEIWGYHKDGREGCRLLACCLYDPGPETIRTTPNDPLLLSYSPLGMTRAALWVVPCAMNF